MEQNSMKQLLDSLAESRKENKENIKFIERLTIILIISTLIVGLLEILDGIFFQGKFAIAIPEADRTDLISGIALILGAVLMFVTHVLRYKYNELGRISIIFISAVWGGLGVWYSYYMMTYKVITIIWVLCLSTSFICILIAKRGDYH